MTPSKNLYVFLQNPQTQKKIMPTILPPTLLSQDPSLHDPHITVESTSCSTKEERGTGDDTAHTFCVLNKYKILLEKRIEIPCFLS